MALERLSRRSPVLPLHLIVSMFSFGLQLALTDLTDLLLILIVAEKLLTEQMYTKGTFFIEYQLKEALSVNMITAMFFVMYLN